MYSKCGPYKTQQIPLKNRRAGSVQFLLELIVHSCMGRNKFSAQNLTSHPLKALKFSGVHKSVHLVHIHVQTHTNNQLACNYFKGRCASKSQSLHILKQMIWVCNSPRSGCTQICTLGSPLVDITLAWGDSMSVQKRDKSISLISMLEKSFHSLL